MTSEAEEIWRTATSDAQSEIETLSSDMSRLQAALDSLESRAGMLDHSTVDVDASPEQSVVRGDRLISVTTSGVKDIRRALIDATDALDDLRRALDFYHH